MNIIFFGTPTFSYTILKSLYDHHKILAVVTQPDEKKTKPSPVKKFALEHDLLLFQPQKVKDIDQTLMALNPDIYITAAFGQFIPNTILKHRPAINIHASLLPQYRGAAPIQYAIKDGCHETGITIMYMEKEMDAGNIIAKKAVHINEEDTTTSLTHTLSHIGASLLLETLPMFEGDLPEGQQQDPNLVCFAPKWKAEDELLHLDLDVNTFINVVRANAASPGATLKTDQLTLKIYQVRKNDIIQPGPIGYVHVSKKTLSLSLRDGVIDLLEIQIPGKKKLLIKDFLNGQKTFFEGMIIKEI